MVSLMTKVKTKTTVTKRTVHSARFSEEEVEEILREYVKAPHDADVVFNIGYDGWRRGVDISWEEVCQDD